MFYTVLTLISLVGLCVSDDYSKKSGGGYRGDKSSSGGQAYSGGVDSYHREESYGSDDSKSGANYKGGRYYYGGKYSGKCGPDGLYYRDDYSFVLCSNGKGYVQPCAPGTRNSGYNDYAPGYYYGYSDFCDVNLVDYGYSAPKHGPGYSDKPSFGFAAYRYPVGGSGGQGPKSLGGYSQNVYNKYDGQGYGHRDSSSYGTGRERYDQPHNTGYQTRNNYKYKETQH